jgi:hypothetical protein
MKKMPADSFKVAGSLFLLLTLLPNVPFIPWWSFVVPVFILGIIIARRRWKVKSFAVGFITGFITWFSATLYFDFLYHGGLTHKLGKAVLLSSFCLSGLICGLLTGLSLYVGKCIFITETGPADL